MKEELARRLLQRWLNSFSDYSGEYLKEAQNEEESVSTLIKDTKQYLNGRLSNPYWWYAFTQEEYNCICDENRSWEAADHQEFEGDDSERFLNLLVEYALERQPSLEDVPISSLKEAIKYCYSGFN